MTTAALLKTLRKAGKPVCLSHIYRLFLVLDIKPLGRSRPQIYPPDTAERIKAHLGISAGGSQRSPAPHRRTLAGTNDRPPKLVTVAQLRAAKPSKIKSKP